MLPFIISAMKRKLRFLNMDPAQVERRRARKGMQAYRAKMRTQKKMESAVGEVLQSIVTPRVGRHEGAGLLQSIPSNARIGPVAGDALISVCV